MATGSDTVVRELEGLRALARALVAGEPEAADDLLQDAALAALEHPPETDRPVRPWLAAVLRNRRRMDRRATQRRQRRDLAAVPDDTATIEDPIDRARTLERLSAALVALEEPYRTAVIRRYLDGETAAEIARALEIPAGTVRWRLKTGLDRLRAALDHDAPAWRRILLPFAPFAKGAVLVKVKTKLAFVVLVLLCMGTGMWWLAHDRGHSPSAARTIAKLPGPIIVSPATDAAGAPVRDPLPGQGRAIVATDPVAGGLASGRVVNWSTADGVAGADLTFSGEAGAITIRSRDDGTFELAPTAPGDFTLTAIAATGFLPYAPEYLHSSVHFALAKDRSVRGITVFLYPALDYHGRVVDAGGAAVAGAHVKLLGTPSGEQTIDRLATEWTSAADGTFTFHAADDAVFEAVRGKQRGWARLDGSVAITKQLVIKLGDVPAHDATISGHVVDHDGHPLADVLVRASPTTGSAGSELPRATGFATSGPDGAFVFDHVDRDSYDLESEAEGHAGVRLRVQGGAAAVTLMIETGVVVSGAVVTSKDEPVPAFTLTVFRRQGAARAFEVSRSIVDPLGHFAIHVMPGDLELVATAAGWAPNEPARVNTSATVANVRLVVSVGGTLRGTVVDAVDHAGLPYARVMREARGGGASTQPANAGTVTRADGTFELTGIPPGAVAITIGAGDYHPKIVGDLTATDDEVTGPITIAMTKLAPGEEPTLELVGIGVKLSADGDSLLVEMVIPNSGAAAAGIIVGDHILAVDGVATRDLGVDGAVAKIRGAEGSTVAITILRGTVTTVLAVERRKLHA